MKKTDTTQLAPGEESTPFPLRKELALLLPFLLTVIGVALRLYMLGTKSLWLDEASSVAFARLSWPEFLRTMWYGEANMAFYYVLLRAWLHLGDSEFCLRALSVLFGAATIPVVYLFGKRFLSRGCGLIAAALLVVHSFHIRYSQELRSYSLLVLLLTLSAYLFLSALEIPGKRMPWVWYVIVSSLAIYTQVFAVFVLAGQWLVFTPARIKRTGIYTLLCTGLGMAAAAFPMAAVMFLQNKGQLDWVPHPTISGVLAVMQNITGLAPEDSQVSARTVAFLGLYFLMLGFGVFSFLTKRREEQRQGNMSVAVGLLASWLAFPVAAMLAVSFLKPIFIPRYLVMCVPAATLLAGHGLVTLKNFSGRGRFVSAGAFVALFALSLVATRDYFVGFATYGHDWRGVTHYILSHQEPEDAAIFYSFSGHRVYDYYLQRQRETAGSTSSPTVLFPLQLDRQTIETRTKPYRRIWLVLDRSAGTGETAKNAELIAGSLRTHFRRTEEQKFPGAASIYLALYVALPLLEEPVTKQAAP